MPDLNEYIECDQDAKDFFALDIKGAFYNVEIEEGSKHLAGLIM